MRRSYATSGSNRERSISTGTVFTVPIRAARRIGGSFARGWRARASPTVTIGRRKTNGGVHPRARPRYSPDSSRAEPSGASEERAASVFAREKEPGGSRTSLLGRSRARAADRERREQEKEHGNRESRN